MLLVSLHIAQNPTFSPIDEITHYDYVTRMAQGKIPRFGQEIQASSLRIFECTGIAYPPVHMPPCGTPENADVRRALVDALPQYEAQQPPVYYMGTVPLRWVAIHVFGFTDLAGTRIAGLVWLIVGMLLIWAACRLVGVEPRWIGAGLLLLATAPVTIYSASTVTNDAGAIFAGGAALLAGALAWRRPGRWTLPSLFLVGIVVTSIKGVNLLAVFTVAAVLLVSEVQPGPDGRRHFVAGIRRWLPSGGSLALGGFLAGLGWPLVSRTLALVDPSTIPTWEVQRSSPSGFSDILRQATSLWSPLNGSYAPFHASPSGIIESVRATNLASVTSVILTYLLVAGGLAGLFVTRRSWSHVMGLVAMLTLYLGGVAIGYALHVTYNINPGVSGRYGLAVAPMLIVALVASAKGAWVRRGLWVFGLVALAVDVFATVAS